MMSRWALLSVAVFLTSNAVADILVQPGYEQQHPMLQPHSLLHSQPILQPLATLQHASENQEAQKPELFHPGYHIELHPVYSNMDQANLNVGSYPLMHHQLAPYMSRAAIRRMNAGKLGGHALTGALPGAPVQYLPMPVHSRYRRSSSDESAAWTGRDKRDENDVAKNSSLNENNPLVVDLQARNGESTKNLEEKNVKVRQSNPNQSTNGNSLLGLNPSNMYPANNQYRSVLTVPQYPTLKPQNINVQTHPQLTSILNSLSTSREAPSQNQATTSTQTAVPQTKLENLQHAMLLQHPAPQQNGASQTQDERNFPDPRPVSATQFTKMETPSKQDEPRTAEVPKQAEANDDKEIVGTHLANMKESRHHLHQHQSLEAPNLGPGGSYVYLIVNPNSGVQNGPLNNFQVAQNAAPQVYQLPSVQGTNYPASSKYAVLSGTYGSTSPSSASTLRLCFQTPDTVPSVTY